MKNPMRHPLRIVAIASVALAGLACGALRQNLRNQFVSYRGAWFCEQAGCSSSDVIESKRGRSRGELQIDQVKMQPHTGLVFYPGAPVTGMTATVRDCKGKSKEIPKDKVQSPSRHKIAAQKDAWVIWLDERLVSDLEVGSGDCSVLVVKTHATWDDGSTYECEGAVEVEG